MGVRYTVKQVADLTGVPAPTLRAWERRYGVVAPRRSSSRYRLYDDGEVARLSRMATLVREGTPASLAAERVSAPGGVDRVGTEVAVPWPPFGDLVLAAQHYDQSLLSSVLDNAFSHTSFEVALEQWLLPALAELGHAWVRDEVDISGEHFVSAAVQRRLSAAFDAAGSNIGAPVAIVGLGPGAMHQLGAMSFAVCLQRQGIDVRFLGADVPQDSWVHSVRTLRPDGVVVTVPMAQDVDTAVHLVRAIVTAHPEVAIWAGGHGSAAGVGSQALPQSLVDAASLVARELQSR